MRATVTEENVGRFLNAIDDEIERKPDREVSYRTLANKIEKHFDKPIETFRIDGLKRLGRKPVERRVEVCRGETDTRDGLIFDVDFLLVDDYGYCFTVAEAANGHLLTEDEILEKGEQIRNGNLGSSD